jgi:hypothetical protein
MPPPPPSRRYWLNVALVVLVAAGFLLYSNRVMGSMDVRLWFASGSALTLWLLWERLRGWLKWAVGDRFTLAIRDSLGKPLTSRLLGGAVVLLVILFSTTSVFSLTYASNLSSSFYVQVLLDGEAKPILEDSLSPRNTKLGDFFFSFRPRDVRFVITDPGGYEPHVVRMNPWTSVARTVPGDFSPKRLRVVRFFPGRGLTESLALPGDSMIVRYDLRMILDGAPHWVRDLRQDQPVYIGGAARDIEAEIPSDGANWRGEYARYTQELDTPELARRIAEMEKKKRVLSTPGLTCGQTIQLELWRADSLFRRMPTDSVSCGDLNDRVQTIFVEVLE